MAVKEVDWLELPDHLTLFMTDKLSCCDFIRFGAVCKPWNFVYNAHSRHSLPRQLPLLLVPNFNQNLDHIHYTHTLYEFHEKRMYRSKVLVPLFMYYKGSSHGCLVLVWEQGKEFHVRISYPLLTKHKDIDLPPLKGLSYIRKVALSANPSSNQDYIVMAMVINDENDLRFAFFKPAVGDKAKWTYIDHRPGRIRDILYYNKYQQFYFVNDSGMVSACDLNDPNDPKVLPIILAPPPYSSFRQHDNNDWPLSKHLYLAELSSGELLLIVKYEHCLKLPSGASRLYIIGFSAYKMNPLVEPKWIEMQNLCGDTIFLGEFFSLSVRVSDFCECKPNCIYFTDDCYLNEDSEWTDVDHIGVFNLEEGILVERYPIRHQVLMQPPIWIEPTVP